MKITSARKKKKLHTHGVQRLWKSALGITMAIMLCTFAILFATAYPYGVDFVTPTPPNQTVTLNTSVIINASLSNTSTASSIVYNWNGTNYSFYNSSVLLWMGLDNLSGLGENNSFVADGSRFNNNGTVRGTATWNSSGRFNGAYTFDSSTDYINMTNTSPFYFNNASKYTWSMWIKPLQFDNRNGWPDIYNQMIDVTTGFNIYATNKSDPYLPGGVTTNGISVWVYTDGGGLGIVADCDNCITLGNWQHLVVTYDGTLTMSNRIKVYMNGVDSTGGSYVQGSYFSSFQPTDVGIGNDKSGDWFNGSVDEVIVWNRSLNSSEIGQLYMTNIFKFNSTQWYLYVNQSKNATAGLDDGAYTYKAFAANASSYASQSEERTINIGIVINITNCAALQAIRLNLSRDYHLGNNINCTFDTQNPAGALYDSGSGFEPLGNSGSPFTGSFDGHGFNITGLKVNRPTRDYTGLFGYVQSGSIIKNVGLDSINITGASETGGFIGMNLGKVNNSHASGYLYGGGSGGTMGGLIGYNDGVVNDSYANVSVNATMNADDVGGFVGQCRYNCIINRSYAAGNVVGGNYLIGGFVGKAYGTIDKSYALGSVNSSAFSIGGFVGMARAGTIQNSYSKGDVINSVSLLDMFTYDDYETGGFVGLVDAGSASNSFSSGNVFGGNSNSTGGFAGYISTSGGQITNSFSSGNVSGNVRVGGFAGYNAITISTVYWNNNTGTPAHCWANSTGNYSTGCIAIQDNVNYFKDDVYPLNPPIANWSFFSVWKEALEDYPHLEWEAVGGNVPTPILINFISPTPNNGTTTLNTSITVNASIRVVNLSNLTYNWNETNYTLYDSSLKLMMNFDNLSAIGENNSIVKDIGLFGNDGTVYGATINSSGKYNKAFSFDGQNDYIEMEDSTSLNISGNQITLTAWVLCLPIMTPHIIIAKPVNNSNHIYPYFSYSLHIIESNIPRFWMTIGGGDYAVESSHACVVNQWNHIAGVYNGTDIMIYLNGNLTGSTPRTGSITPYPSKLRIGTNGGLSEIFNGSIDEVRIYNRSFTRDEISVLYASNLQKFNSSQWYLYVNQSKNSTDGLDDGTYTYRAFATDSETIANQTEQRTITISEIFTEISSCQELNIANAYYQLTSNVSSNTTCFNITANGVILDGNGFTINYSANGSLGYGVNITGYNSTIIKNLIIREGKVNSASKHGIYLNGANKGRIENNIILTNASSAYGIYSISSSNNTIINNSITTNGSASYGIYLNAGANSTLEDNSIRTNGSSAYVIYLVSSRNNSLNNNNIASNGSSGYAIYLSSSHNSTLIDNIVGTNSGSAYGIYISASTNNTLLRNNVLTNGSTSHSMFISSCTNSTIRENIATTRSTSAYAYYLLSDINTSLINNQGNSSIGVSYVVEGTSESNYNISLDSSNLAEGLAVGYNSSVRDKIIYQNQDLRGTFGQLMCGWCVNVSYINISVGNDSISLFNTTRSKIANSSSESNNGYNLFLHKSSNNTVSNISINNSYNIISIYILSNSVNNTIESSNISTNGSNGNSIGISIQTTSHNNLVRSNTIKAFVGVAIGSGCVNNTFDSNMINGTSPTGSGNAYAFQISGANNTFINNLINGTGRGFDLNTASYQNITNNTIITNGISSPGISFSNGNSAGSILRNNNIITRNGDSSALEIFNGMHNFTMIDTVLNSTYAGVTDFRIRQSTSLGIWNLTNVTRTNSSERINITWATGSYGTLIMNWWLDTYVANNTGPLESVEVNVTDTDAINRYSSTTSASGTSRAILTEYIRNNTNGADYIYYSNYTLNITKAEAGTAEVIFNLTTNRYQEFWLATEITTCQTLNISNGHFKLISNITSNGTCFNITAENVTLDGNGYTINYSMDGSIAYAVNATGYNGITIKNAIMQAFTTGPGYREAIHISSNNSIIQNNTIYLGQIWDLGISSSGNNISIINNIIDANGKTNNYGAYVSATNSIISSNTIRGLGSASEGIRDDYSTNLNITSNNITGNGQSVFAARQYYCSQCYMEDNKFNITGGPDSYGYYVIGGINYLSDNTVNVSGTNGISLHATTYNTQTLTNNSFSTYGDNGYGIYAAAYSEIIALNNTINTYGDNAFGIYSASNEYVLTATNNTIVTTGTGSHGVYLYKSPRSVFSGNHINTSSGLGFVISGTVKNDYNQTISTNNLAEGMPIQFNFSIDNQLFQDSDDEYGQVICVWCTNAIYDNISMSGGDGFLFANSSDSGVQNSRLSSDKGFGAYIIEQSRNIRIINTTINTTTNDYLYGIYINSSNSSNISSNIINTSGTGSFAISLLNSNSSTISSNTLLTGGYNTFGIFMNQSDNNRITYLNLSTTATDSSGIRIAESTYNNLSDLNISITNSYSDGIWISDSDYNIFTSTNISNIGYTAYGFSIVASDNNLLQDIDISTSGSNGDGLMIYDSSYNNFTSVWVNVSSSSALGLAINGNSDRNRLINTEIISNGAAIMDTTGDSTTNYIILNNSHGQISWTNQSNGGFLKNLSISSHNFTLGANIIISSNKVYINSSYYSGININSSANITLYGLPTNFVNPIITKDGIDCSASCINFTTLNAGTVRFNVSSWSNYSIEEGPSISAPSIEFIKATPTNSTVTHNTNVRINISIADANLANLTYNWNGSNYTEYDDSLLLMLNMNNNSAIGDSIGVVSDSSLYNNDFTVDDDYGGGWCVAVSQNGRYGSGYYYSGHSCTMYRNDSIVTGFPFTIEAWVNDTYDGLGSWIVVIRNDNGGAPNYATPYYGLYLNDVGCMQARPDTGYEDGTSICGSQLINDSKWHHYVAVFASATDRKLYIDGQIAVNSSLSRTFGDTVNMVQIGADVVDGFKGFVDEVKIWNRTLSADEVSQRHMTNLYKYNTTLWHLSVNQSKNSTAGLDDGLYTYQAFASNSASSLNQTESRQIIVDTIRPYVAFTSPTPADASSQTTNSIFVNVSSSDLNGHYTLTDLDRTMVLWLRMEDVNQTTPGAMIYDNSSYRLNATAFGNATQNISGKFGNSYTFDGNNDYISIPASQALNLSNFSISFWGYFSGMSGTYEFVYDFLGTGYALFDSSGHFRIAFTNGTGESNYYNSVASNSWVANRWQHYVAVYNVSGSILNVTLYRNATRIGSAQFNEGFTPERLLYISTNGASSFNGSLDEFIMFNRSLGTTEIQSLYNATANQYQNNFTILSDGAHTLRAYTVDGAGNLNQTESRTVNVNSIGTIYWICNGAIQSFTNTSCWSRGRIPVAGDDVIFNGSGTGNCNITNNTMAQNFNSFSVGSGYNGEIYFNAKYAQGTWATAEKGTYNGDMSTNILSMHLNQDPSYGENSTFIYDFSGNYNNGTCTGTACPAFSADGGRIGSGAYVFDGSNDIIDLGTIDNHPLLNLSNKNFTISTWVKLTDDKYENQIINQKPNAAVILGTNNDINSGKFTSAFVTDSANYLNCDDVIPQANTWYHVVYRYNWTHGAIFIDGNYCNSVAVSGTLFSQSGMNWYVGDSSYTWNGTIDEIQIINKSLSAIEIRTLYLRGLPGTQEWNVTGNINISGGTMKVYGDHPESISPEGHGQVWRSLNGNITLGTGAIIDGIGLGFGSQAGPGAGSGGAGGSHGGYGVNMYVIYGNESAPTSLGSGGLTSGGSGIKLISDKMIINGIVNMSGNGGSNSRAGAGGSIWLVANNLSGNGKVDAKGGDDDLAYAAGGGRLRFDFSSYSFIGYISVAKGTSHPSFVSRPGTFSFTNNTYPRDWIVNGSIGLAAGNYTVNGNMIIPNGNSIGVHPLNWTATGNGTGVSINVLGNVTMQTTSIIDGIDEGFLGGPGVGGENSGGTYGGRGGFNSQNVYGSDTYPISLGSAGLAGGLPGGMGAGAIQISSDETLSIEGNISMTPALYRGGRLGSGGSILLIAASIIGNGNINASGGSSVTDGCPSGGGRIALHAQIINFNGTIENKGGTDNGDCTASSGGTIYLNATQSLNIAGNISVTGYNGSYLSSDWGQRMNITSPLVILPGIYTSTVFNSSINGVRNGTISVTYTDCSSTTTGTFTPSADITAPDCIIPSIAFISPTPNNGTSTRNISFIANISITEQNLANLTYNWNGTNYTFYDGSLILMMNLDNRSAIGDNVSNAADVSIYSNSGTFVNGTIWNSSGKYGGSATFDGVNDYIRLNKSRVGNFERTDSFTVMAWVYRQSNQSFDPILGKYNSSGNYRGYFLGYEPRSGEVCNKNSLLFDLISAYSGDNRLMLCSPANSTMINRWQHIAFTYSGTSSPSGVKLYINGVNQTLTVIRNTLTNSILNYHDPHIGDDLDSSVLNGSIDNLLIFNRSLSKSEIEMAYASSLQKFNSTQWYLYLNQSKNSTAGLDYGTYDYLAYARDQADNSNQTEQRRITIQNSSEITECGLLDTPNTAYYLMNDIDNYASTCFEITASNVTFNGNRHHIDGVDNVATDYGIYAHDARNITITNFSYISDFGGWDSDIEVWTGSGIHLLRVNNSNVSNLNLTSQYAYGMILQMSYNNVVERINASQNGDSDLALLSANLNNISILNSSSTSGSGIYMSSSHNNTIRDSYADNHNSNSGLNIANSHNNTLINLSISSNSQGISLSSSNNNKIVNTTLSSNLVYGIYLLGDNNNFTNVTINSTTQNQIYMSGVCLNSEFNSVRFYGTANNYYDILMNFAGNDGTKFIDTVVGNYSFSGLGSKIIYTNSSSGQINFTQAVNGSGRNLSLKIAIKNNNAYVNSSTTGLNRSANITLYNMPANFSYPAVLKDGSICTNCYNFTSLNLSTVVFNVSSWSNYSIGEDPSILTSCGYLTIAGATYTLLNSINNYVGTCFQIQADNITLNGNGNTIDGTDDLYYGIYASGRVNLTVKNFMNITDFGGCPEACGGSGIYLQNVNNTRITNISSNSNRFGVFLSGSNNTVSDIISNSNDRGIIGSSGNNNVIGNVTSNSNSYGIYLDTNFNNNNMINITTNSNGIAGVYIVSSSNNMISYLTSNSNNFYGISLVSNSSNNSISNSSINASVRDAIYLSSLSVSNNIFNNISITNTNSSWRDIFYSAASINGTQFIDMPNIGNYSINGTIIVKRTGISEIGFLEPVNERGINLTRDLQIGNNSVYVNSTQAGLNKSANVTLYGIGDRGFTKPIIVKDSVKCGEACHNFTPLDQDTVIFNVTGWSNYSISDTVVGFLLTLPGSAPVESTDPGSNTNIMNFESTTNTNYNVLPCVESTMDCQTGTLPFFIYSNIGNVNLTVQLYLDANLTSVFNLKAATSNDSSTALNISTTPLTIGSNISSGSNFSVYFWGDFINAYPSDSTVRNLTSEGTES